MTTAVLCHEAVPRITAQLCARILLCVLQGLFLLHIMGGRVHNNLRHSSEVGRETTFPPLPSSPQLPEVNKVALIIQEFIPAKRILEIYSSKEKAAVSSGGGREKIKQNVKYRKKIIQISV